MDIHTLVDKAFLRDLSDPSALSDAFDSIRLLEPEDFKLAHERNKEVRRLSAKFAEEQKSGACCLMRRMILMRIVVTLNGTAIH